MSPTQAHALYHQPSALSAPPTPSPLSQTPCASGYQAKAMPLRVIRSPIKAREALLAATVFASITVDVSDMVQFTPVRAAAGLLLVILQTIQEMDANKDACYRLARRAATILLDLRRRMDGRWDDAPRALIENIQDFEKCVFVHLIYSCDAKDAGQGYSLRFETTCKGSRSLDGWVVYSTSTASKMR